MFHGSEQRPEPVFRLIPLGGLLGNHDHPSFLHDMPDFSDDWPPAKGVSTVLGERFLLNSNLNSGPFWLLERGQRKCTFRLTQGNWGIFFPLMFLIFVIMSIQMIKKLTCN